VCAITDKSNIKVTPEYHCYQVTKQLVPLYVGFTVLGLGICFGYNCGYAVNPARDLAPRLFTALAGWGPGVFTSYSHWWVVPVLSCHAGGVAGAWLYYMAVELHWAGKNEEDQGSYPADDKFADDAREAFDTVDDDKYNPLPVKYDSQEELRRNLKRYGHDL
jgi:hypothetical protein